MADERPRDVRDSLSELEQRLRELERELRSDATRDADAARRRVPVPGPQSGATATAAPERPAAHAAWTEGPGGRGQEPGGFGSPRAGDASGAGNVMAGGDEPPGPPPLDVGPLVEDTRRKVDALRESLDGLTGASDRLREVAQVVVEDHGRALVRLERATGQSARAALAAPLETVFPAPAAPRETEAPAPAAPRATEARTPAAPAAEPPRRDAPGAGQALGEPRTARETPIGAPPAAPRPWHERRWAWPVMALLATVLTVVVLTLISGSDEPVRTTPTVPGAMSRIALTPELGPDTRAFDGVPGTRPASDAGAVDDLCDGVVGAAVVITVSGSDDVPPCLGLVTVASGTVSALALAERGGGGERTCVAAGDVPSIAAARPNRALTAARDAVVQRATTRAERAVANSKLTPGERAGRVHTAAFEAGRAFDTRRRLRLLAVREQFGRPCVVPGRDDVASGRYPLASRVALLARQDSLDQLAVDRAAAVVGHLTSGPAPISATVLREER